MTKDKFIKFIKDNRHKFVFISYRGGMGGEAICNYLTQKTDYFYNETLIYDMFDNKKHIFGHFKLHAETPTNNYHSQIESKARSLFLDWMFGNWFVSYSLGSKYSSISYPSADGLRFAAYDTVLGWDEFYDEFYHSLYTVTQRDRKPAVNCVFGWDVTERDDIWDYEWEDCDNEMDEVLERFAAQDKPYLIRMHGVFPLMKFFKGAKIIEFTANEWMLYASTLGQGKVYCYPITGAKNIRLAIDQVVYNYVYGHEFWIKESRRNDEIPQMHTEEEGQDMRWRILNYIGDALHDPEWNLYFKTLDVIVYPEVYNIDYKTLNVKELNMMVLSLNMIESFQELLPHWLSLKFTEWQSGGPWGTKVDEPNHKWKWWPNIYQQERWWFDIINPQLYNMNDIFSGEWIKEQFGLDPKPMKECMDLWHKNNIEFFKKIHISRDWP